MDLGLEGRCAIVTGGSRGIGTSVALTLAREGCDVAINYRKSDREAAALVEQVQAMGRRGLAVKADVSSFSDAEAMVARVVEELGRLDILVCNAGITWDGVVWKMTERQWDAVIDVNLKGYFNYNRAAAQVFIKAKYGKIVNVASINGLRGKFGQCNYAASKGGEIALSKTLARELGKFNVNVNVVAPGMVMTEMAESIPAEFLNKAVDETMLGRIASPQDCADVIAFLCSDRSRHVTGEVIKIDGGQYI